MFYSLFLADWFKNKKCNLNANLNAKYVFLAYFKTRKNVYPINYKTSAMVFLYQKLIEILLNWIGKIALSYIGFNYCAHTETC